MKTLITITLTSLALTVAGFAKPPGKHMVPFTMTPHAHSNQVKAAARAEAVKNWEAANPGARIGLQVKHDRSHSSRFATRGVK